MNRKRVTRRDALGLIGKTGITLSTGPFFFLSLKTSPLEAGLLEPAPQRSQERSGKPRAVPTAIPENVMISGSGSKLKVTVSGPVGRHCGVAYATTDTQESYRAVKRGLGVIAKNGVCIIDIDTKTLPNQKVFLRVVTGSSSDFSNDVKGTKPFEVVVEGGAVSRFLGVRERPMKDAVAAASCAAACISAPPAR